MEKNQRNIYLKSVEFEEALKSYREAIEKRGIRRRTRRISSKEALHFVTAEPVFALDSSPNFSAAAMDGIATVSHKTMGASETRPVFLKEEEDFVYINTGGVIKHPYDTVIMIEDVVELNEGQLEIRKSAPCWQHIREIGEDVVEGELILPSRHRIRSMDIGAILAGRVKEITVYDPPRVGILPTGSEITDVEAPKAEGRIIDSNSHMFRGMVEEVGGIAKTYPVTPDHYEALREQILKGVEENDVFVINAGSSAGSKDFTASIIRELGDVLIHGVAIKPGKPIILGFINNKPVIGIPGYPVSAYVDFKYFVEPILLFLMGIGEEHKEMIMAQMTRRVVSSLKHLEFVRVKLGFVKNRFVATPLNRGAGVSTSLVKADGMMPIPKGKEGFDQGEQVSVELLKPKEAIKNTIVSVGSHDVVMDLIGDYLQSGSGKTRLSSAHVGSFGGILALKNRECHIAPMHILDEKEGTYNVERIKKSLPNESIVLISLVKRSQGLIIPKGNPKGIKDLKDVVQKGLQFVNRQRGAGTRILLEFCLQREEINPCDLIGYDRELTTHTSVAAAVKWGTADVGLGVYSAAKAMDLDFLPLEWESYDLAIRKDDLELEMIQALLMTLKDPVLREKILALGGYNVKTMGQITVID